MKTIKIILSLMVSALFLYLAFHKVNAQHVWASLKQIKLGYVWLYLLTNVISQFFKIYRFDVIIKPFADVSKSSLYRISNLGMLLVTILPLRLGELARPYLLKQEAGTPLSSGIAAVVVERCIDGLLVTLLFFLTIASLGSNYPIPFAVKTGGYVAFAIFSCALIVVLTALFTQNFVPQLIRKLGHPISIKLTEKMLGMLQAFIEGLRALPNFKAVFWLVNFTFLYWVINALGFYWLILAFDWNLPVAAGFMIISILVVGIMIPAGPAFLGTYQGSILVALSIFGIKGADAAAYGLIAYPLAILVTLAFGLPYLFTAKKNDYLANALNANS